MTTSATASWARASACSSCIPSCNICRSCSRSRAGTDTARTPRKSRSCVTSTPAPASRYRWTVLSAGVFAQAAYAATGLGLPAIAPAIRHDFGLTLTQTGVVLAAGFLGSLATLLLWGIVADVVGERVVIAAGQAMTAAALVWAGYASSFVELVAAIAVAGGLGAGVNAASGRAVMAWFAEEERGLALGIR